MVKRRGRTKQRQYTPATHYTPEELERARLADLLNDARADLKYARQLAAGADPRHYGMTREQYLESAARARSEYRSARRKPRANPAVLVFGNPPERTRPWDRATVVSKRAVAIEYDHVSDGKLYRHPFARGVVVEALVDGSVRLYRPDGKPLWKMFNR